MKQFSTRFLLLLPLLLYWNTAEVVQAQTKKVRLPIGMESADVNYDLLSFGNATAEIVSDPFRANNKVISVNKPDGADTWAGTIVGNAGLEHPIQFSAGNTTFTMDVYSPLAGIKVLIKLENASNGSISVETSATVTAANQWQTLSFDFTKNETGTPALNLSATYSKVVVFMNFGTTGAADGNAVYYFDNISHPPTDNYSGPVIPPSPAVLPVTFDTAGVNYNLTDFGGNGSTIGADPTNAANKVAITTKGTAGELWAGTTLFGTTGFDSKVPLTTSNTKMTLRVYAPHAPIQVRLKLEEAADPTKTVETEATVTQANTWQTLTFDFSKQAEGTAPLNLSLNYNKASVFFNFGVTGAAAGEKTYYWDDLAMSTAVNPPPAAVLPVTFDTAGVNYNLTDFGGNGSTIGADPTNAANKVAITTKGTAGEIWAGTTLFGTTGFDSKVPLTTSNTKMTLRVYAPHAPIQVRLKLEEAADPTKTVETEATVTQANTWQTLTFDFAKQVEGTAPLNLSLNYNKASVFFNFGVTGAAAGEKTYYWDDLAMSTTVNPPPAAELPVTFDTAGVNYNLTDFGGNGSTIGADPTNAANKVAITTKGTAGEIWAGTTLFGSTGFDSKVPLTAANTKMTLRVYAPHAPIQVRLKLEEAADPTKTVETEATVTQANTWQTLTFDFSKQAEGTAPLNLSLNYNKASVFFNFGVTGAAAGEKTYYWDDLAMSTAANPPSPAELPVTFDTAGVNYNLTDFGGNSSVIGADPTNAANKVAITTKGTAGETWAGTTMFGSTGFDKKIRFNSVDTKMTVRVYSPHAPIQVRLKVEDAADPTKSVETEATVTQANTWQTLTFDFAKQAEGTAPLNLSLNYNKASIFFNFGVTGAAAGEKTYYWDDVIFNSTVSTETEIPIGFDLQQNYPNPFNPSTTIPFELNKSGYVKLSVYDVTGRLVAKLVNQPLSAGNYRVSLDASDLNSGMYFYRLEVDQHQVVKKMTLLR